MKMPRTDACQILHFITQLCAQQEKQVDIVDNDVWKLDELFIILHVFSVIRVKLMIETLWKLIPANLLSIHFEQSRSFCFQTYKDKELRQIIIMRLKWPDLSLQMTENVGLFVGAQCTSKVTIAPVSIPNQCRKSIHRCHNRFYNHGEGPYQGLLALSHLRHY